MSDGSGSYSRFLSGDRDAIEEVIKDYKDGLIYYIYSIIGDMELSEEAAIDVFIKLYVDKPVFNGNSAFKTEKSSFSFAPYCSALRIPQTS